MEGFKDNCGLRGMIKIEKISALGEVEVREIPNTITNTGKQQVASLLLTDVGGTAFDYLAIGTASTAPSTANTALGSEAYRVAGAGTRVTGSSGISDSSRLSGSFNITTTATMREMGIFNSSSTGIMLGRATFSDLAVNNGDTVNAVYTVIVG